ncbi:hypothetical protein CHELA1G11_10717 [Hyphomicrobiales bacterium]|nr:hypothetical protein CHELA1G11_10717 [Hyphomicrobiales bacterium]
MCPRSEMNLSSAIERRSAFRSPVHQGNTWSRQAVQTGLRAAYALGATPSGNSAEVVAKTLGTAFAKQGVNKGMFALPDRDCLCQQGLATRGQRQKAAALIPRVRRDRDELAPLEGFQGSRQCCPVHRQKRSHGTDRRWKRPIQRHQQRELPVR